MMKKKITNILKYILIGCFLLCFFPIYVLADSSYYALPANTCLNSTYNNKHTHYISNTDTRIVAVGNKANVENSTGGYVYFVTATQGMYNVQNGVSSDACSTPVGYNQPITVDGNTFYAYKMSLSSVTGNRKFVINCNIPYYVKDTRSYDEIGIYYTFGDGVPEPTPEPINWGLVRDPEYSTRIAGNGYAAKRNIDYLSWNNEVDSNGNDISECTINIKAVLGSWSGTTQEELINKTYNDFNIGNYTAVNLGSVPASSGMFSVSWQRIIDEAGWNFDSLYSHFEDNIFLKQGWYYQLQLVDPEGGTHQWQTLYTPLSSSAKSSETIINHNSFDQDIYQIYEELTQINNNTSITINIENTDYTVQNPDNGDEPQEGVDLWDILKQMLNGIFQIVKNIAALPGKFLEMIQQLITPPQQISEEINNNFNNNMQDLNESQPGLMESMNAVEDIQDTLNQSVNSFNGVPECIFTWDAVTMDLSAFNAGTVTFIAAGSFDFAASFMQMINGFGMTYSEYQFYVSAIIYAWILVFIYRHVYDFLAGTKEN